MMVDQPPPASVSQSVRRLNMVDEALTHREVGGSWLLLVTLMLAGGLTGFQCGPPSSSDGDVSPHLPTLSQNAVQTELPSRLVFGSGGGFTGRWEGYIIEEDGSVWTWSGYGLPGDSTLVGQLPPDSLRQLGDALAEAEFYNDTTAVTGNITAFLEVTRGDEVHRVSWIPSVEGVEPPASPTEAVYRRARALAASAGER